MANLVIWTESGRGVGLPDRGDVIEVFPDDWVFSRIEMENPNWRIVSLPAMAESEASSFLGGPLDEPGIPPASYRAVYLDLDDAKLVPIRDSGPGLVEMSLDFATLDTLRRPRGT